LPRRAVAHGEMDVQPKLRASRGVRQEEKASVRL